MADERVGLAYDAGVKALAQQDSTLGNLRNRATGLLSAAALITSVSAGIGLIDTKNATGDTLPLWGSLLLLAILVVIGALSMKVLWPVPGWCFGPDSIQILKMLDDGKDLDTIQRFVANEMGDGRRRNSRRLKVLARCYQAAVILLLVEVITIVAIVAM